MYSNTPKLPHSRTSSRPLKKSGKGLQNRSGFSIHKQSPLFIHQIFVKKKKVKMARPTGCEQKNIIIFTIGKCVCLSYQTFQLWGENKMHVLQGFKHI